MRDVADRDAFIVHMKSRDIIAPFHYVPLHSAPGGEKFGRYDQALLVTDDISARLVRLPLYYSLGDDIDAVVDATLSFLGANA